jgi:hypothetical protein
MKVRGTTARTALGVRLTALCWGALALTAPVAVSACTSGSSTPSVPTFTASVTNSPTATGSATAPASSGRTPSAGGSTRGSTGSSTGTSGSTPGVTSSSPAPERTTATVTRAATAPTTSSASRIPSAAPGTGGGGIAGLQDGLLFVAGAAAILAGAGSILYRRRLTRDR